MKLSPSHLRQYGNIARLLWKYGRSDLVKGMAAEQGFAALMPADATVASPEELADDLEAMGPTYVKLGQILASRPDLLPEPYLQSLSRLHDQVKPFSFAEVEDIVTTELGVRISRAFSYFEQTPMAAASLGQVHRAALRDGREVVVKVQRPGIVPRIVEDFEVLGELGEWLDAHTEFGRRHRVRQVLEEFRLTIEQELDYRREAQNLILVGANLADFEHIHVPQPVEDYCSRRVLTMDYVRGRKITSLGPLTRLEMNGEILAEELFRAYLKQVLVDGLFHADPHPGNVFLTSDHRIALLDLGMVGHTTPAMQENLLKLLLAVSEGRSEEAVRIVLAISATADDYRLGDFEKRLGQLVARQQNRSLEEIQVGRLLLQVAQMAGQDGIYVPSELTLLAKTLLQLDEVGKTLDPAFDPNAAIRRNTGQILSQRMRKQATQGSVMSSALEMKDFLAELPTRLNRIMDAVTRSELEVKVRAMDAGLVMEGLQKVANRIASGLILAALIVGASLLMRVDTNFRLFGYPGLAILCFLAAAGGGFWLVIGIFLQDHKRDREPPR